MKVSVVMPVFNKAPFLLEAVQSILSGTFADLELICVDDRSTDGSVAVLRTVTDPRMRIIELAANLGPAGAANAGLDAAQGQYIVRMDADDIAVPERIALQVAFMDAHPTVGASGGQVVLFGESTALWPFPTAADDCAAQLIFGVPVSQGASVLRRSILEDHGARYDPNWPRVGEDWLFWLRLAKFTRFANLDEVLIHYRRGPQNISHGRDKFKDFTALQKEAFQAFNIPYTSEELDLHLMGSFIFKVKPTSRRVRALRKWYDSLLELNADLGFAPHPAFAKRINEQWDRLFHYLPRYGAGPALEHLRINGKYPMDRLTYLVKYRFNALRGKVANG